MASYPRLGEVLKRAGVIDDYQLATALAEQDRWGHRLGVTLIKLGYVEEDALVRALAHQMRLPLASLEGRHIEWDALRRVPAEVAEQSMTLPLCVVNVNGKEVLYLGMEDPTNLGVLDDLRFRSGTEIRPVLVAPSELAEAIDRFYRTGGYVGSEMAAPMSEGILESDQIPIDDLALPEPLPLDTPTEQRDLPGEGIVVHHVNKIALDATPVLGVFGEPEPELELREDAPDPSPPRPKAPVAPLATPEAASPARGPAGPGNDGPAPGDSTRTILQAVTQLLVEKGVLEGEELRRRIRVLEKRATRPSDTNTAS